MGHVENYLCLAKLLIFDTKYSFLVLKYTEVTCSRLESLHADTHVCTHTSPVVKL